MEWKDLKTNPPTGKEHAILLFPCRTDCGLLYITNNPHYAIKNGVKNGYTHWAEIQFAPTHAYWSEWQESIRAEENEKSLDSAIKNLQELNVVPFEDETDEVILRRREAAIKMAETFRQNSERYTKEHQDIEQSLDFPPQRHVETWSGAQLEEMGMYETFDKALFLSGCSKHSISDFGYIVTEKNLRDFAAFIIKYQDEKES